MRRLHSVAEDDEGEVAEVEEDGVSPSPGVLVVGEDPSGIFDVVDVCVIVELVELDDVDESRDVVAGAMATGVSAT